MAHAGSKKDFYIQSFVKTAPDARFFGPDIGYLRLNHNEMSGLIPPSLLKKIFLKNPDILGVYPSYDTLHQEIATYIKAPKENIQTTNGSDDAIPKLVRILFNTTKPVILPVPVFPTYERVLKTEGIPILEIPYVQIENRFDFPVTEVLQAVRSGKTQGLIICNPSNPLGSGIEKEDLLLLVKETAKKNIPLVVDEAYFEFHNVSALPLMRAHPHIIVLRTFSKTFGLAGIRIGYIVAAPPVIKNIQKLILPWEVNHVAVSAALAVLDSKVHFFKELKKTKNRGVRLEKLLKQHGIKVFETHVNFVVCKTAHAKKLVALLKKQKVMVRHLDYAAHQIPYLRDCVRISIPGPGIEKEAFRRIGRALKEYAPL